MAKILLFATLADHAGQGEVVEALEGPTSVEDLFERLEKRWPELSKHRSHVRAAVNQEYADWETTVRDEDEIAFFPPVSGGAR